MMISLRRSLGSKFCAGLFILLIVLPFTAPFRAWDSGTPFGKPPSNDLKTSDDLSNTAAVAADTTSATPVTASDRLRPRPTHLTAGRCGLRVLRMVLRL